MVELSAARFDHLRALHHPLVPLSSLHVIIIMIIKHKKVDRGEVESITVRQNQSLYDGQGNYHAYGSTNVGKGPGKRHISYYVIYYNVISYDIMLCYVMLCYVMLCYAMSCYVVLCDVM